MKKITSLEYNTFIWFLIRACFAETTFACILAIVKQDSWISILFGVLLGIIPFILFEYLKHKYPDENLVTLNIKLFNKTSYIINFILLIGCVISAICTFWILIKFSNSLFLYKTSSFIISLAYIIPIWYVVSKGINTLGKVSLTLFYIGLFIIFITIVSLISGIDISNFKPIFENNINSIFYSSIIFNSLNIMEIFFLTLIPKNKIKNYSVKKNLLFYVLACLSLLNVAVITICTFGIDLSTLYEYPVFQILKRVNLFGVFDRVESLISTEWIFALFIQISLIIFYINEIFSKSFNLTKKANKYLNIIICFGIFLISNFIFITNEEGENFLTNYIPYIIYFCFLLIPIITLIKSLKDVKIIKEQNYSSGNDT